ncbi:MAG TPA: hypothetical protein VFH51_02680 [Myxococcota bacterium]|nr:hypothetical protein [Myxococcota bacterium]
MPARPFTCLLVSLGLWTGCASTRGPGTPQEGAPGPLLTTPPCDAVCDVNDSGGSNTPWLRTQGGRLLTDAGAAWESRGATSIDLQAWLCAGAVPPPADLDTRLSTLLAGTPADLIRVNVASCGPGGGPHTFTTDERYKAALKHLVDSLGKRRATYVLLSLQPASAEAWTEVASTFVATPHVLFGVGPKPRVGRWQDLVSAIRGVEDRAGTPHHVIAIQGVGPGAKPISDNVIFDVQRPLAAL